MSKQTMRDDIQAYIVHNKAYCEDCFVKQFFPGKRNRGAFNKNINNDVFRTLDGTSFDLITETTVQYESYPHQIIPAKGIFCCKCSSELYAPDDSELRKHRFIFTEQENRDNCTNHLAEMLDIDDSDVEDNEDTQEETPTYETICYTYEEIDDFTLERICKQFSVSSYEVNSPVY